MQDLFEIILHTDDVLLALVSDNTTKAYVVLFLIIFAETGLVIFPFLPGDALIFSAGVIAAASSLNIYWLIILLIIAGIGGNLLNYVIGSYLGHRIKNSRRNFVQKYFWSYLSKTKRFYDKYGGRAIMAGRFFPVIRTYIPFLAGMSHMPFLLFLNYTVFGAIVWVLIFALPGYWVGEIPWVKENFALIFVALVPVLLFPVFVKLLKKWLEGRREKNIR